MKDYLIQKRVDGIKVKIYHVDPDTETEIAEYVYYYSEDFDEKLEQAIRTLKTSIINYYKAKSLNVEEL